MPLTFITAAKINNLKMYWGSNELKNSKLEERNFKPDVFGGKKMGTKRKKQNKNRRNEKENWTKLNETFGCKLYTFV